MVSVADPAVLAALTGGADTLALTLAAAGALGVGVSIGLIGLKKGFAYFRTLIKI